MLYVFLFLIMGVIFLVVSDTTGISPSNILKAAGYFALFLILLCVYIGFIGWVFKSVFQL